MQNRTPSYQDPMILVSTLRGLLVMPYKSYAHLGVTLRTRWYWFLKQSTMREQLAMPSKIVRPPSSNPAYPAILVSSLRELLVMPYKWYAHLGVTLRTRWYWFLKQSILGELLAMLDKIVYPTFRTRRYWFLMLEEVFAMLCKIVRRLTSNPAYRYCFMIQNWRHWEDKL